MDILQTKSERVDKMEKTISLILSKNRGVIGNMTIRQLSEDLVDLLDGGLYAD